MSVLALKRPNGGDEDYIPPRTPTSQMRAEIPARKAPAMGRRRDMRRSLLRFDRRYAFSRKYNWRANGWRESSDTCFEWRILGLD